MELVQLRGASWDERTSDLENRSISIVADERLEVCDGEHWAFVMKKSKAPPSLRDRTGRPPSMKVPTQAKRRLEWATRQRVDAINIAQRLIP